MKPRKFKRKKVVTKRQKIANQKNGKLGGRPVTNGNGWSAKKEMFCYEYLIDLNGAKAAIRAGYSEKTAYWKANGLLSEPLIQQRILELKTDRIRRLELSADKIIKELSRIAFADPKNYYDENDQPKQITELTSDESSVIESWQHETKRDYKGFQKTIVKVKLHSKMQAIRMLGAHLGMVLESSSSNVNVTKGPTEEHEKEMNTWRELTKHLTVDEINELRNLYGKAENRRRTKGNTSK